MEIFVDGAGWTAGIFDFQRDIEISRLVGTSAQKAFRSEIDPFGKISVGDAPDVGRRAAAGTKKDVEFHSRLNGRQGRILHDQRRNLRHQRAGEAGQNRKEANGLDEIHLGWFDFTLGTA